MLLTRDLSTTTAPAPLKLSMAAPMAVSSWKTEGEAASAGSTVFAFFIIGSGTTPPVVCVCVKDLLELVEAD